MCQETHSVICLSVDRQRKELLARSQAEKRAPRQVTGTHVAVEPRKLQARKAWIMART